MAKRQKTKRPAVRIFTAFLRVAIIGYAVILLMAFGAQRELIFPAKQVMGRYSTPSEYGWEYEEVTLSVREESTYGWYVPLENARGVVLFSHGNGGNISSRLERIQFLRELGFSVLAYDYGGYGNSTGKASEKRCYADALAMWNWLIDEKGSRSDQIVLYGRSLGGAVAIDLATKVKPAAVVSESSFLSMVDMGKYKFPWLPVNLLLRHRFMNKNKITNIDAPILIVHSPDDMLIPYQHGEQLFKLAKKPKTFLKIRGDHNEGARQTTDLYRETLQAFMEPILPMPKQENDITE